MLVKSLLQSPFRIAVLAILAASFGAVSAHAADAGLAGTRWRLVSVGALTAAAGRNEPFFLLDQDGQLSGSTGCNRFAGGYVIDGSYLSFGQVATTRMFCTEVWEQERAILDALPLVARWQVTGSRLELLDGGGQVLAVFESG